MNQTRNSYYGNNYTPHMFTGGGDSGSGPPIWRNHALDMIGQDTPVTISLSGGINGYDVAVSITVSSEEDINRVPMRLFVVATMDSVHYVGSNGLAMHEHTIIDFISPVSGESMVLNGVDDIVSNFTWSMDPNWPNNSQVSWDINNLNIVVFTQDYVTKEVYQAETSRANAMNNDSDNDGYADWDDNCPQDYNPAQEDSDGDGLGDVCDPCDNLNVFALGNLNGDVADGQPIIDLFDVLTMVDMILAGDYSGCSAEASDLNGDGSINVQDVVLLVQLIIEPGTQEPPPGAVPTGSIMQIDDHTSSQLVLSSAALLAGIQFSFRRDSHHPDIFSDLRLPAGWVLASENRGEKTNVICYDISGKNSVQALIIDLPVRIDLEVNDIVASTKNGTPVDIKMIKDTQPANIELPTEVTVKELFPNPFNPVVSIPFSIPYETNTRVVVYDITGKLVEILLQDPHLTAGNYNLTWDATNYASGLYLIQVQTPSQRVTRKAFLVK